MSKPYMPLMMGDWIKGTRGMRAEARGVYLGLLLHQYDQGPGPKGEGGWIPTDLESLQLIDPEVAKVWHLLRDKFPEFEPGKGRNAKCEEVRRFWQKQAENGKKRRAPAKAPARSQPDHEPNSKPNPEPNLDYDHNLDLDQVLKRALDEITLDRLRLNYGSRCDFDREVHDFTTKVLSAPAHYKDHDVPGLRLAFNLQLRNAKPRTNGNTTSKKQSAIDQLILGHARRHSEPAAD